MHKAKERDESQKEVLPSMIYPSMCSHAFRASRPHREQPAMGVVYAVIRITGKLLFRSSRLLE